jgi:translation elongation factor EF-G
VINAMVPPVNMFGYFNTLRLLSHGRAMFTMRFDHYRDAPVPLPDGDPTFRPAMGMRA